MEGKDKKIYIPIDYLKFEDKKNLSILIDLFYWKNSDNLVNITLDKLIKDCGYKPKTGVGKTNDKFKLSLSYLQKQNIIKCDTKLNDIKLKQLITIEVENFEKDKRYTMLYYSEYRKIMQDNVKSTMKDNMLLLYITIKRGIGARDCYGREIVYKQVTNKTLMNNCNISKDTLSGCLKELSGLGLIYYDNIGYIIKNDTCRKAINVYALNYDGLEVGLKNSKKYYEDKGYIFESKEHKSKRIEEEFEDKDIELSERDLYMIEMMDWLN